MGENQNQNQDDFDFEDIDLDPGSGDGAISTVGDPTHNDGMPNPYAVPEVEDLLEEVIEILAEARPLPMSTTVKVNRDELLELLEQALDKLPEELRAARWLLKERDVFVAKARQEHRDLIEEGKSQVGRMVERQQVVKAAEARARQIVADATDDANNLTRQIEDYCDQRLASFEVVLNRTLGTIGKGRERLLGSAKANTEEILGVAKTEDSDLIDLTIGEPEPSEI